MTTFKIKQAIPSTKVVISKGIPTLVIQISESRVNKLQEGPPPISPPETLVSFWTFIESWGGN
jgi:hypothetical protein